MITDTPPHQIPPLAPGEVFQQATEHHQAGRLAEAERLYRSILQTDPNHPDVNHNLGLMALQAGQPQAALDHFTVVLNADPARGENWLNCIEVLFQLGRTGEAKEVLTLARQHGLEGGGVDALAARLAEAGAQPSYPQPGKDKDNASRTRAAGKAPAAKGKTPNAHEIHKLAEMFNKGRYGEAANFARKLTSRFPGHGFGWKLLGAALCQMGQYADALQPMQQAADLSPNDAEVHVNLGAVLKQAGRINAAEASFRKAILINPRLALAYSNLGAVFHESGRRGKAVEYYSKALEIDPRCDDALSNLGVILLDAGDLNGAEASFRQALNVKPRSAAALGNLGITLKSMGKLDEAEASYRRALKIKPDFADGYYNLASILLDRGRLDEAEANYRRLLELNPDHAAAHSSLLFCLAQKTTSDADALFAEHCLFGERFESPYRAGWGRFEHNRDPGRVLKVGFVSGDFRNHAIAYFIESILACLSTDPRLSLYAYYNHEVEDSVTGRLRGHFREWRPVFASTDASLEQRIREDGIDILIDLSSHTFKNRLPVFARKPAPVQVTWMGYPGTTGMRSMDYFLTDKSFLPRGPLENQFTEKIVYLPASVCFLPSEDAPPVNDLPALENGYITFGSFNRPGKLSREVIALWAKLLRALPDSRMVLGAIPEDSRGMLIDWFSQESVAQERLSFYPFCSMDVYLGLHHQTDICLDTFPYNGGTTTLHALWMGVPTLTLAGATTAARSGASILGNVRLDAFVTHAPDDFVQVGLNWAQDLEALAVIRKGLRDRVSGSALGQPAVIAVGLQRALRIMWQRWCAGEAPQAFDADENIRQEGAT